MGDSRVGIYRRKFIGRSAGKNIQGQGAKVVGIGYPAKVNIRMSFIEWIEFFKCVESFKTNYYEKD